MRTDLFQIVDELDLASGGGIAGVDGVAVEGAGAVVVEARVEHRRAERLPANVQVLLGLEPAACHAVAPVGVL